jgi:hypothetical protein
VIHYSLVCDSDHKFDAWFRNAEAYDTQKARGIVTCPVCSSQTVEKAMMAPMIARSSSEKVAFSIGHPQHAELRAMMRALRDKVVKEAENVGDRFAEEARKIHYKEVEERGIYGEATRDEVSALLEEGVDIMPLPNLPEEAN